MYSDMTTRLSNWFKERILIIYHTPAIIRSMLKMGSGRLYYLSSESDEYLRYALYRFSIEPDSDDPEEQSELDRYYRELINEIERRKLNADRRNHGLSS